MSPFWNHVLVAAAIAAAVGYFIWHAFGRKAKGGEGCGGDCGCGERKVKANPTVDKPFTSAIK
jgi:hypothetical protein